MREGSLREWPGQGCDPAGAGSSFPAGRTTFHTFHGGRDADEASGHGPQQGTTSALRGGATAPAHGHSLRQLGDRLGWDWSLFGKMEKGETVGGPEVVQALDVHYGTPGLLLALWELAVSDKTQFKERYRRYMALEAEAVSLWHFAVSVLPGLLQTPAYAREVLSAGGLKGEALDQQVEARMGRRELLAGEDVPQFRTILSEAVLRTSLRDPQG
ncbi:Helix-turn-helix domain protein [Streptomyces microflavus DSM 40593]|uniref:Helix-turn-helix domain protein n=1 Tax=Streptomyces microflavus DSM 40593 TaxID=1303692 RepID=N0CY83_STRMI|nr:Helix-turn-helix domain protein [Streptomyces microflavus DSM 40593]